MAIPACYDLIKKDIVKEDGKRLSAKGKDQRMRECVTGNIAFIKILKMLSNKNLGYFIIAGVCLMAALILVQVHWARQALKANQENWKQQVKEQLYLFGNDILISKNQGRTPRVLPISNQHYRIKLATKASVEEIKKALGKNLAPFTDQKYNWSLIDIAEGSLVFVNTSLSCIYQIKREPHFN
jgi:cell division protein FtsL